MKFVDEAKILTRSGNGGAGAVSFRREKYIEFGGPDGGNGGKGGDIVVEAVTNLNTLVDYRYTQHYYAPVGGHGMGANRTGAGGTDLVMRLPVGTQVIDEETGTILADLVKEGQRQVLLPGGRGGRGNASYKTSTNQAPRQHTPGALGIEKSLILRLKLIADVGLVGLPNAGKSTFLRAVSRAKPKVGAYAFTTLKPGLGVVSHGGSEFVMADLPGLIAGASEGVGLGHHFLKHLERCRAILHLVDATAPDPVADYRIIRKELKAYDKAFGTALYTLPCVIGLNKCDELTIDEASKVRTDFAKRTKTKPLTVSGAGGVGVPQVLAAVHPLLAAAT